MAPALRALEIANVVATNIRGCRDEALFDERQVCERVIATIQAAVARRSGRYLAVRLESHGGFQIFTFLKPC